MNPLVAAAGPWRPFGEGEHRVARGLCLRVRGDGASWVLRFTSPSTGKRREMGLGVVNIYDRRVFQEQLQAAKVLAAKLQTDVRSGISISQAPRAPPRAFAAPTPF